MTPSATLLVELRTEELPPKSLKRLGEAFAQGLVTSLREHDFVAADSDVRMFATPRRLAVSIASVLAVAPDKPFKEKLLPVSVAFDAAGKPTAALLGKLKGKQLTHLDPATLPREHDGKAEVLYYADVAKGGPLVNALQSALDAAIEKLPIAKVMSYAGAGGVLQQPEIRPSGTRPGRAARRKRRRRACPRVDCGPHNRRAPISQQSRPGHRKRRRLRAHARGRRQGRSLTSRNAARRSSRRWNERRNTQG